jgi:hypothetical protein
MTRRLANPRGSPCHRYPAFASFPPTGPALLGARFRASPGIRVSRSGRSRRIQRRAAAEAQKNPPERRLGRVRRNGFSISYQKRSPPGVARPHINGPWPFRLVAGISRHSIIAQLASGIGTIPGRGMSLVGLILIVNRQSIKTQSCRDGALGCGGEDTKVPPPALAGEGAP